MTMSVQLTYPMYEVPVRPIEDPLMTFTKIIKIIRCKNLIVFLFIEAPTSHEGFHNPATGTNYTEDLSRHCINAEAYIIQKP